MKASSLFTDTSTVWLAGVVASAAERREIE